MTNISFIISLLIHTVTSLKLLVICEGISDEICVSIHVLCVSDALSDALHALEPIFYSLDAVQKCAVFSSF